MKIFALSMILFLSGCSTVATNMASTIPIENSTRSIVLKENQLFTTTPGTDAKVIRWVRLSHDELQKKCASITDKRISENSKFLGCAAPTTTGQCVVFTGTTTTHQILGHEVRHCYHGAFHD